MGVIVHVPTLTDLWHTGAERVFLANNDEADYATGLTTGIYDNLLSTDSMEYDLDVSDLWLTSQRWTKLQRDYLELERLELFLDQCKRISEKHAKRGVIAQMLCKTHDFSAVGKSTQGAHTWGNCMLGMTFHGSPKWRQPTITLHSRVTYIAYLGGMDIALAYVVAKEVAELIGIEVEDMAFRWHLDSLQWHGMKSMPYLYAQGLVDEVLEDEREYPSSQFPSVKASRRCLRVLQKKHQENYPLEAPYEKYGPVRRMRTRYQYYIENGKPAQPSIPLDTLTLEALRR